MAKKPANAIQGLAAKSNQLTRKLMFTCFFIALYRIGVHIPIPGVDTEALRRFFEDQGGNLFGMFNMLSGGALERFSVVALGVMPYISASIIAQLLTVVMPYLDQLQKEGESGRKKITQYTRYGTILLAVVQGLMIAKGLQSQGVVMDGGSTSWILMSALSLTAGTAFVMWLGEQITERGVGNGISLIIFAGIIAGLPQIIMNTYSKVNSQEMELFKIIFIVAVIIVTTAGVVFLSLIHI